MPDRTLSIFIPSFTRNCEGLEIAASSSRRAGVMPRWRDARACGAHPQLTIPIAFAMTRDRPRARFVARGPTSWANRRATVDFAVEQRMPGMYPWREFVEASGLMSYGVSAPDQYRRAADYVDKILKGAAPGDLPIQQPGKVELVSDLKTAKA